MLADNGERFRVENYKSAGINIFGKAEQPNILYRNH